MFTNVNRHWLDALVFTIEKTDTTTARCQLHRKNSIISCSQEGGNNFG